MKIITPGNSPFRKRCDRCSCVFEYENGDIRMLEDTDCCGGLGTLTPYVSCPTCNQDVYAPRVESSHKKNDGLEDFNGTYL